MTPKVVIIRFQETFGTTRANWVSGNWLFYFNLLLNIFLFSIYILPQAFSIEVNDITVSSASSIRISSIELGEKTRADSRRLRKYELSILWMEWIAKQSIRNRRHVSAAAQVKPLTSSIPHYSHAWLMMLNDSIKLHERSNHHRRLAVDVHWKTFAAWQGFSRMVVVDVSC
jgi:hypothetical protein